MLVGVFLLAGACKKEYRSIEFCVGPVADNVALNDSLLVVNCSDENHLSVQVHSIFLSQLVGPLDTGYVLFPDTGNYVVSIANAGTLATGGPHTHKVVEVY